MNSTVNNKKMAYNTDEACEILSINRCLLDAYRRRGLINCIKVGRFYIYPKNELESFLNRYIGKSISKEGIIYD